MELEETLMNPPTSTKRWHKKVDTWYCSRTPSVSSSPKSVWGSIQYPVSLTGNSKGYGLKLIFRCGCDETRDSYPIQIWYQINSNSDWNPGIPDDFQFRKIPRFSSGIPGSEFSYIFHTLFEKKLAFKKKNLFSSFLKAWQYILLV